jgi:pyruvate-formate lyase-activating enzyme
MESNPRILDFAAKLLMENQVHVDANHPDYVAPQTISAPTTEEECAAVA